MRTKEIVLGGLLTGLALLIPLVFRGYLQVAIPPFSATLCSHVPEMLAMLVSPAAAVMVGIGSTVGFLATLGPVVAVRAFVHVFWGALGAVLVRRGWPLWGALLVALPIHALGEALVVLPFGFTLYKAFVLVGLGTLLHHVADSGITLLVAQVVARQLAVRPVFGREAH